MRIQSLSHRELRSTDLIIIASLGVAVLSGRAVGEGNLLLAFLPPTLIAGLASLVQLQLAGWCLLLLLLTVVSRGVVATLALPDIFNFIHYPATLAFAFAASQRPRRGRTPSPAGRWMASLLLLTAISSVANSTNPLRALMFVVILGQPILVIWAIQRWGADEAAEARVGRLAFIALLIQIPIGLWQGYGGGWEDSVQGTLVGHGAGAHALGGLFALGLFIWLAGVVTGRHSWVTAGIAGGIAFGMMGAASAIQVILLAAAALPLLVLLRPREPSLGTHVRAQWSASRMAIAALLVLLGLGALSWANFVIPGITSRAASLVNPSEAQEVVLARERARSNPMQLILGSGPGTSASRAALLLTPLYGKPGSFFKDLPLEPTALALGYSRSSTSAFGGSVESAASSMLGVIGDLGLIGFLGLVFLLVQIYRESNKANSWLAPAVAAALLMTFGLSFIDNWLEYPEFAVPLAILIGFATGRRASSYGSESIPTRTSGGRVTSIAYPHRA